MLRRTATLCAVAVFGAVSLLGADKLGLFSGSASTRRLHISVRESLTLLIGVGPSGPGSISVAFNENVTNTGTLPVSAVIVRPGHANPDSGWVLPGTSCGVGDIANAGKFNASHTNRHLPITGELCKFKHALGPGQTTLIGYLSKFTSPSQAEAFARAGAKVIALTPPQTAAYAKKGLGSGGADRGKFGSPAPPSTGSPKTVSS